MQTNIRIAIIGGGPGGLTLARLLAVHGVAATVFERDAHAEVRPQGGSLDLHVDSGLRALDLAGLTAGFDRLARPADQEVRVYDKDGALLYADVDVDGGERPEIDRSALRGLLLGSLPVDAVRWGQKVQAMVRDGDGRHAVVGEAGSDDGERFDLVVGADGAWSKVRPLLSPVGPAYSGVTFVEMGIDDLDRRYPELGALVGRGKIFALGEARGIIAQRNDHGHVRVYAAFRAPEAWLRGAVDFSHPERARADLLRQFAGWAPALTAFIAAAGDRIEPRPIVVLPIGHRWTSRPGLTLLGDAAHVMSPFSGEGVNIAMRDATELALRLTAGSDWRAAVAGYEADLFARAEEAATGAAFGMDAALSDAAPQSMVALFQSLQQPAA